jgi:hypothetical protein
MDGLIEWRLDKKNENENVVNNGVYDRETVFLVSTYRSRKMLRMRRLGANGCPVRRSLCFFRSGT